MSAAGAAEGSQGQVPIHRYAALGKDLTIGMSPERATEVEMVSVALSGLRVYLSSDPGVPPRPDTTGLVLHPWLNSAAAARLVDCHNQN